MNPSSLESVVCFHSVDWRFLLACAVVHRCAGASERGEGKADRDPVLQVQGVGALRFKVPRSNREFVTRQPGNGASAEYQQDSRIMRACSCCQEKGLEVVRMLSISRI